MGSAVKKVTTLPRKIIKTVKKNPALLALAAPIAFPTAFAGVTAASSGAFLQGAAKRALIQALATKATGGDVSIKDSLIGGAVGQGIGQFAGNAAMFKGVDPKLLQAGIGAATNVGSSLARGQEIDPRSALISGGLNYLTTPGASQPSPNAMGGNIPEETITPTTTSAIEDLDAQTYNIPGYTRQFGTSESLPDALASVGENIDTSQLSNLVKTTDGKIDFLQTGYLKQIGSDLMKGNFADAADLSLQVVKDNPFETIAAITAAAPLFFSPVPQEGETEEDFAQRKVDVTNYLRQYGSNFYSGKDLDDFISRTTSNLGYAQGGRVGFAAGSGGYESFKDFIEDTGDEEIMDVYIDVLKGIQPEEALFKLLRKKGYQTYAQGGRVEVMGGGIMGLGKIPMGTPRMNQGGVTELDYRAEGGFVPVGIKEKADDVPAMLSKNEFVMTADAVRAAGNGSIEKGAQKMYDTMKQLESRVV